MDERRLKHVEIGAGHDANTTQLNKLSGNLFWAYPYGDVPIEWHRYDSRVKGGDRRNKPFGLPWCKLTFPFLTRDEYEYLRDNICETEDALVTLHVQDKHTREWGTYNAIMEWPEEPKDELGGWRDIEFVFYDLEEI